MTNSPTSSPSQLIPHFPPVWVEVFGEDDCGIFAECSVKEVRFFWRWICPGRFQMGCDPEDEHGYEDEKPQHEVILTRGFWLGETPVTQAQWQAVMGDNPSRFKGDQRPVEQVTWTECRDFATKLNDLLPGLHAAAFAYLSDWWINFASVGLHLRQLPVGRRMYIASLNHCLWLHRPFAADQWLHVATDSPSTHDGRGFSWGRIHDRAGTLVASVSQESMLMPADEGSA